jgi:putative transposase
LDENCQAAGPNQKRAGDISHFWKAEGWLYLAVIVDLFSSRVIGWAASHMLKRDVPIETLRRAISLLCPPLRVIHIPDK